MLASGQGRPCHLELAFGRHPDPDRFGGGIVEQGAVVGMTPLDPERLRDSPPAIRIAVGHGHDLDRRQRAERPDVEGLGDPARIR